MNLKSLLSHPKAPWVLFLFWFLPPLIARCLTGTWAQAGAIGDAFGIANSIFSGIALLGLVANMQSAQSEATERDRRYASEQAALREQTIQLALATRLNVSRSLIATHRSALLELNPGIKSVPTSAKLLNELKSSIARDAASKIITESIATEMQAHLDELEELQKEVTNIRNQLEKIYASAPTHAGVIQ